MYASCVVLTFLCPCRYEYQPGELGSMLEIIACIKGVATLLQHAESWLSAYLHQAMYAQMQRIVQLLLAQTGSQDKVHKVLLCIMHVARVSIAHLGFVDLDHSSQHYQHQCKNQAHCRHSLLSDQADLCFLLLALQGSMYLVRAQHHGLITLSPPDGVPYTTRWSSTHMHMQLSHSGCSA